MFFVPPVFSNHKNVWVQFFATRYVFKLMVRNYYINTPQGPQHFHSLVKWNNRYIRLVRFHNTIGGNTYCKKIT